MIVLFCDFFLVVNSILFLFVKYLNVFKLKFIWLYFEFDFIFVVKIELINIMIVISFKFFKFFSMMKFIILKRNKVIDVMVKFMCVL